MKLTTGLRSLFLHAAGSAMLSLAGTLALEASAAAATLASASFTYAFGALPAATFPGAGASGTSTSNLSASLSAGGAFNGAFTTTIPTTAAPPLTVLQVVITKNAGGTFTGTAPGKVGGDLAIQGVANVYGLGGYSVPLLAVPLNLGTPNTSVSGGGGVYITVIAGSWTAGTAVVTGVPTSQPSASVTAMGGNGLTAGGAGTLVLVAPLKVVSGIAGNIASFGVLTLTYVPEPGTLLLCGLGVAALGALGRRSR